jgi:hypothetical protein
MSDDPEINPYELFGLSTDAADQDIRTAYRKLSLKVHPDRVCGHIRPALDLAHHVALKEQEQPGSRSVALEQTLHKNISGLTRAYEHTPKI